MEKELQRKFTYHIVDALLQRYNCTLHTSELIGTHQSFVYRCVDNAANIYIRITLHTHRIYSQIAAELDMITYLARNAFGVAEPINSRYGNSIEVFHTDEDIFYCVAFKEAPGLGVGQYPWSLRVPYRVGRMNGHLHRLLEMYSPPSTLRYQWYENPFITQAGRYLPEGSESVVEALDSVVSHIQKLPKSQESYGLIHGDMVACNYHMTDDSITLFDFDEACYCWFVNDIAVNTFYAALGWKGEINIGDMKETFKIFMDGYSSERQIDSFWLSTIPLFMKLREIILFVSIHRSKNIRHLDNWSRNFMQARKECIENHIPFADVDFAGLI